MCDWHTLSVPSDGAALTPHPLSAQGVGDIVRGLNNVINPNDARRLLIKGQATEVLNYFVNYCHYRDLAAKAYLTCGTDPIEELTKLAEQIYSEFPRSIFFTSKLIFERDNWYIRQLRADRRLRCNFAHGLTTVLQVGKRFRCTGVETKGPMRGGFAC
jgi:hypothetical protein